MTDVDLPNAALLRAVLSEMPAFIVSLDASLRIKYTNRLQRGLSREQVIGQPVHGLATPSQRDTLVDLLERALATGETQKHLFRAIEVDNRVDYYDTLIVPYAEADASERSVCLIAMDVTDHVSQSNALRASEQKLRVAVEGSGLGLWTWDLQTSEVTWNQRLHDIVGTSGEASIEHYMAAVHPDDRDRVAGAMRDTESGMDRTIDHRIVTPDGDVRWISPTRTTILTDEQGNPTFLVGGLFDVTEQRHTEARLRDAQKMDALGNLTAGVAHNFNNMLAVMMPAIEAALPAVEGRARDLLADAAHAARRSADMVAQLMAFTGQRRTAHRLPTDLRALVERVVAMCRQTFDRRVTIATNIASDLPALRVEQAAIEQVLFNLLLNARDAVAGNADAPARIEVTASVGGDRAVISVIDNGCGIPEELHSRIFEPFFTTKSTGKGTGLGLAVSQATVREHEGTIDVVSHSGQGTTVTVTLPLDATQQPASERGVPAKSHGRARILLIDDEAAIRRVVGEVLETLGHEVQAAEDIASALRHLHQEPTPELILLDRSMPETVPTEAIAAIRKAAPRATLLFFTGQDVPAEEAGLVDGILNKPLAIDELEGAIDGWLSGHGHSD